MCFSRYNILWIHGREFIKCVTKCATLLCLLMKVLPTPGTSKVHGTIKQPIRWQLFSLISWRQPMGIRLRWRLRSHAHSAMQTLTLHYAPLRLKDVLKVHENFCPTCKKWVRGNIFKQETIGLWLHTGQSICPIAFRPVGAVPSSCFNRPWSMVDSGKQDLKVSVE